MNPRPPRTLPAPQLANARRLRREMTRHETMLWSRLRNSQLGHKFSRQISIGPFIADFVCRQARLVVELDGSRHNVVQDARRDDWMAAQGYQVLRFQNQQLDADIEAVLRVIWLHLTDPPPAPPACGRGDS
ncbi:MAG: DUF559 domain-containing protein [Sphingomonadales bacterium]|jgi:BirA family biotin operon repressor/biotin-[acetyl-CoA-carboxylase] ligase